MFTRLKDRRTVVWIFFAILFLLLGLRLVQITIVKGDEYAEKALDYRLKKHTSIARRGEIYDRNGVLLAGNGTNLYLEYLYNYMNEADFEKMCIDLFTLLESQGEKHIELPIVLKNDSFVYQSDIEKQKWIEKMNFSVYSNARKIFDQISAREGIDVELNPYSRQQLLISKGLYLPIGIFEDEDGNPEMLFLQDREKRQFLESYDLDYSTSAAEAFQVIRDYYNVSEDLTDKEASYVLTMKHYIRNLGYVKYEPIEIAPRISEKTSILISENKINFPDVSVGIKPYRYYPLKNTCSHILGYMGPISRQDEIEKYNEESGYDLKDFIGKIGIEASYEEVLHGTKGVKWYDVNSAGEVVGELDNKHDEKFKNTEAISGSDIELTIDTEFQKKVEKAVKNDIEALQTGGVFKSRFGNYKFRDKYKYARTAAVVCIDVETSEVLAMVSYPDYDVNLFTGGIKVDDWLQLQGNNKNDPLGPKPMYNLATMAAVQPGSTFKMVTSFAALKAGLDPYRRLQAKGVINMPDGSTFGCWIWNLFKGSHGSLNLMEGIAHSCNYYFYSVGSGYDYGSERSLGIDMNAEKILEAAKIFGLSEPSGVEIDELVAGVPDAETKKHIVVESLKNKITLLADENLPSHITNNRDVFDSKLNELTNFCLENSEASRTEVFYFLEELFEMEDNKKINKLTDIVKYEYMTQMGSFDSDNFNISIGQGGNRYTPVQMARYVTTIANGGYLQNLTLIKSIDGKPAPRQAFKYIDQDDYIKYLQMGMRLAAETPVCTAVFVNFPVKIAQKTGTAQREGKLSTLDEVSYIETYCDRITDVPLAEISEKADQILRERSIEIGNLYSKIDAEKDKHKIEELKKTLNTYRIDTYLDKGNAMRIAIKELSKNVITDELIDKYKDDYDDFSATVAYAPYDKPKIAVVIMIPQGGSGVNCFPLLREIIGDYLNLWYNIGWNIRKDYNE